MPGQGHAPPRDIPGSGGFAELTRDCGVTGATPNPTIVANAITSSDLYHSLGGCTISTLKRPRAAAQITQIGLSGGGLRHQSMPALSCRKDAGNQAHAWAHTVVSQSML